ncbi:hypothetical protein BDR06DRAFT_1010745 [Suillus hirtellus]|nr:hypothetical protein BDR06DRAFT_1010745 [Suillus hirtellus]
MKAARPANTFSNEYIASHIIREGQAIGLVVVKETVIEDHRAYTSGIMQTKTEIRHNRHEFSMKEGVNVERSVLLFSATSRGFRWKRHRLMSTGRIMKGPCEGSSMRRAPRISLWSPCRSGTESKKSVIPRMHWVNQLGPDLFILSTGQFRKTYNLIAEMPARAPALGHTFFREHPAVFAAPNRLIRGIAGITANADDITGNVLVVKHCQSKKKRDHGLR